MPELDGLRAWAIAVVVLGHLGIRLFVGGGVGVDLFFVLSGFLITHLLLREHDRRGGIDVLAFYRRRAWRLLPALVAMLVAVDVFSWLASSSDLLRANLIGSVWALGFVANWSHEWIGSYIHLWSLSIEEQFYIVWAPLAILVAPRVERSNAAKALLLLAALDLALQAWLYLSGYAGFGTLVNATYAHVYGLLIGSALAMALTRDGRIVTPDWTLWLRRLSLPAFLLLTVTLPLTLSHDAIVTADRPIAIVACATLIGGVVVGGGAWTWVLRLSPVIWLGRISYSLYLWHLPVYVAIDETAWSAGHAFLAALLKLTLSIALAAASFHLVERPLLRRFAARDSTAVKGAVRPATAPA